MAKEGTPLIQQRVTYNSKLKISLLVWNITLSSFYFGYCIVYLGSIPTATLKSIYGITLDDSVTSGILNGCIPIGALIGALCSSIIIPKFSRKNCLLIINAFAFIVGFLVYIEWFPSLVFFRICQGFCVGFYSAIAPLIVKQLSPIQISGVLGTFTQLNVTLGVFLGIFITYVLRKITGDVSANNYWYLVFGVPQITILIQSLILLFVFPYETPKYLLSVGKQEQAKKLIQLIYKPEYVEEIFEQKKADIKLANSSSTLTQVDQIVSESKQNHRKSNPITVVIAIHLAVMQQFSGINAVAIYGGKIAEKATSGELALLIGSLINFEQVLACFVTGIVLTKFGRKVILQIGSLSIGIACLLIMVGFFIQDSSPDASEGLVLFGLFMFMGFFGFSLGPIVWLYIPEIVQPTIVPYSTASNWICAATVIILFPIITDNVLGGNPGVLFAIFTVWMFGSFVFNHFFVVQTKDKQQKDIISEYERIKLC